MKKTLVGAAAALLLLAGCGSGSPEEKEVKTCSIEQDGQKIDITLEGKDNVLQTITVGVDIDLGMDISEDQKDAMKSMILSSLGFEEGDDVQVNLESNDGVLSADVVFDASKESQFMKAIGVDSSDPELPLDEMVKEMENQGATCK